MLRREFLERFFQYKKNRCVRITVVFEPAVDITLADKGKIIKASISCMQELTNTADDVIIGWISKRGGQA
jgi:hypothetical protein